MERIRNFDGLKKVTECFRAESANELLDAGWTMLDIHEGRMTFGWLKEGEPQLTKTEQQYAERRARASVPVN